VTGAEDPRFTWGLVIEVLDVLERHGYRKGDDRHPGQAVGMLATLAATYEQTGEDRPAAIDSESWTCQGCGAPMIGRRPADHRCDQCSLGAGR
jgi:rubrerythrin